MIYLNLTNGIEYLKDWELHEEKTICKPIGSVRFIRIQSTQCEQKNWDMVIQDLDNDFLLNLAIGRHITVVDYSNHINRAARAVAQGLQLIRYVLERRWFNRKVIPIVYNFNCSKYFDEVYRKLDKRTLKKIDYFKKFLLSDGVHLTGRSYTTNKDGKYDFYKEILEEQVKC